MMKFLVTKCKLVKLTFLVKQQLKKNLKLQELIKKYEKFDTLILYDRQAGFFSIYFQAMSAFLLAFINNQRVFFLFNRGLYFSKQREEVSWWGYFFDSDGYDLSSSQNISNKKYVIQKGFEQCDLSFFGETLPRKLGFLLSQHFELNKPIKLKIDNFVNEHFKDVFVIGLHYRGTDKVLGKNKESVRIDYEFIDSILEKIIQYNFPFKLFIATDEKGIVDFIKLKTNLIVCYSEVSRSIDGIPLHSNTNRVPDDVGLEALIDAVLLSKCDFLLRTDSNLSRASEFFNPNLPSINLSLASKDHKNHDKSISSVKVSQQVFKYYNRKSTFLNKIKSSIKY